jgi:hypothetical protein
MGDFGVKGEGVKMRPWLMMIAEAGFPLPLVWLPEMVPQKK